MGKINLYNYEVFLIDYLDGNLNEDTIAELKEFVLVNPQLEIDLNELTLPNVSNEFLSSDFKNTLKKTVAFIEDEQLINYIENKLLDTEKKAFENSLLENKELKKQLELYCKTILHQDFSILFPSKINLHKKPNDLILHNKVLAYFENQLKGSDKLQFEQELKRDNHLQKELNLFNDTKLNPDMDLVFHAKNDLKKDTKVIALFNLKRLLSAAAAILLVIGLAVVFNYNNSDATQTKQVANKQLNKKDNVNSQQLIGLGNLEDTLHQFASKKENTIAQKNSGRVKNNSAKKVVININTLKTSSLVIVNKSQLPDSVTTNNIAVDSKLFITKLPILEDTISSKTAHTDFNQTKQNYLITEDAEDEDLEKASPSKKGFWQYATKIAKRVNKLGFKSINGEETSEQNYSLSFNAFSVEKR